ncbi:membrane hypothetical protein [Azospirillaceae bacterium]
MVFTAASMVLIMYFGHMFDSLSQLILSTIFAVVCVGFLRYYFYIESDQFKIFAVGSFIPYIFWSILEQIVPMTEKYSVTYLVKILPILTVIVVGLDMATRYVTRNRL